MIFERYSMNSSAPLSESGKRDGEWDYAVRVQNLKKVYRTGDTLLTVLNHLDLTVEKGTIVAVVGRSGSGKSTLLNLVGGLDSPTEGVVIVRGTHLETASEEELSEFRNRYIGFIFQFHNLLAEFTVLENVMMPYLIHDFHVSNACKKAIEILRILEIEEKKDSKPNTLSGGESQRVAIARALINEPEIILADEPTGNLDLQTGERVKKVLFDVVRRYGHTMIIVTHNQAVVDEADVTYRLEYGVLKPLLTTVD
jgi:lipoprotein-releasing system ATP-binding protein